MAAWSTGLREAADDLAQALSRWWLWTALGWSDVRQRHSGSVLGSLWISLNIVLMVACLTLVFADALGDSVRSYAPYVAIGLVLWQFLAASLNEGAIVFVGAAETIRNTRLPLSVHVLRLVWRNLAVLAHHAILLPVLLILFRVAPARDAWQVLPGLALLALFGFFSGLLLGLLGARFRDVAPILANLLQLLFFLTPVLWEPSAIGPQIARLAAFNPLAAFIDIIRAPLLGGATSPAAWPIALAVTAATATAAWIALAAMRRRIPYWI